MVELVVLLFMILTLKVVIGSQAQRRCTTGLEKPKEPKIMSEAAENAKLLCHAPATKTPLSPKKDKSRRADPQAEAAAARLRESGLIVNMYDEILMPGTNRQRSDPLAAVFSLPLSNLVERLMRFPMMSITPRGTVTSRSVKYALACQHDLTIWHEHNDAHGALNEFVLRSSNAKEEFSFFVLWALSRVLPELYQKLIGNTFVHAHRSALRR